MTEKILGLEMTFGKHHDLFSFSLELVSPETKGSNVGFFMSVIVYPLSTMTL